jgi:hypothetical protein
VWWDVELWVWMWVRECVWWTRLEIRMRTRMRMCLLAVCSQRHVCLAVGSVSADVDALDRAGGVDVDGEAVGVVVTVVVTVVVVVVVAVVI